MQRVQTANLTQRVQIHATGTKSELKQVTLQRCAKVIATTDAAVGWIVLFVSFSPFQKQYVTSFLSYTLSKTAS